VGRQIELNDVGVVTCLAAHGTSVAPTGAITAALEREGAAIIFDAGCGLVAAFRRVTDAVRAAIAVRGALPASSRIALCAGESRCGEFSAVADKAVRLADQADPGSTVLSRLTASLAIDHLPRDQQLCERRAHVGGSELSYELREAIAQPA